MRFAEKKTSEANLDVGPVNTSKTRRPFPDKDRTTPKRKTPSLPDRPVEKVRGGGGGGEGRRWGVVCGVWWWGWGLVWCGVCVVWWVVVCATRRRSTPVGPLRVRGSPSTWTPLEARAWHASFSCGPPRLSWAHSLPEKCLLGTTPWGVVPRH